MGESKGVSSVPEVLQQGETQPRTPRRALLPAVNPGSSCPGCPSTPSRREMPPRPWSRLCLESVRKANQHAQSMTKSSRSGPVPPPCLTPTLWPALAGEVTKMKEMKAFPKIPAEKRRPPPCLFRELGGTLKQKISNV